MDNKIPDLEELMNSMIDNGVVGITADEQLATHGQLLLTIHTADTGPIKIQLEDVTRVKVDDIPVKFDCAVTSYGIDPLGEILVYLSEPTTDSEFTSKDLQDGLDDLRAHIREYAGERAMQIKEEVFEDGDTIDTRLLREYAESSTADEIYKSPSEDEVIEIYRISGNNYALYFDGGSYEGAKLSSIPPTGLNKLEQSEVWSTAPRESSLSSEQPAV